MIKKCRNIVHIVIVIKYIIGLRLIVFCWTLMISNIEKKMLNDSLYIEPQGWLLNGVVSDNIKNTKDM